jgi:hypothetical protein
MADVPVKLFRASSVRPNTSPTNPSTPVGEEPIIVNPPGTPSGEYVPYTGATGNVDLGEKGLSSGFFKFDTTPTSTPTDQGTMFWDEDDNTVDIILNGYIMKVGEDQFYPVKNQTGSNIAKGVAVRFAGTVGASGRLLIAPFLADGSLPSTRFMGVTAEAIDNGEDGKVLWFGRLRGIDTSAFAEGDILYASTTVAGGFQTTVPTAPNNIVEIAAVVTDAVNGTIFIRPQIISSQTFEQPFQVVSTSGTITDLVATSNRIVFTGTNPIIDGITGGVNGKTIQILFLGTGTLTIGVGGAGVNQFATNGLMVLPVGGSLEAVYYNTKWRCNYGIGNVLSLAFTSSLQRINSKVGINQNFVGGGGSLLVAPTLGSSRCVDIFDGSGNLNGWFDSTGRIFQSRSGNSNESVRRDELYLNYSQTVATAGTINDLAINADCKLLILTGADDLTGVVPVDNTRLLRIEASGANRIIRHESASSTAANRFSIGADLTINAGEVYQFIYTSSRWRRVL